MFQVISIVLLVGVPLFILITFVLSKKMKTSNPLFEKEFPLSEEEVYRVIPAEFLRHLRYMVRHSPVKKKLGSQNYVYLEEQLRYGTIPLTDWIKHDVPIKEGFQPSPQALRKMSILKQYDPQKAAPNTSQLTAIAGGSGRS
jgi:hypothetical protein